MNWKKKLLFESAGRFPEKLCAAFDLRRMTRGLKEKTWIEKGLRPYPVRCLILCIHFRRKRPELKRDYDLQSPCLFLEFSFLWRKRPELKRDYDPSESIIVAYSSLLWRKRPELKRDYDLLALSASSLKQELFRRKRPELKRDYDLSWPAAACCGRKRRKRPELKRDYDISTTCVNAEKTCAEGKDLNWKGITTSQKRFILWLTLLAKEKTWIEKGLRLRSFRYAVLNCITRRKRPELKRDYDLRRFHPLRGLSRKEKTWIEKGLRHVSSDMR